MSQGVAVCCSVLQCVAMCCNVQCVVGCLVFVGLFPHQNPVLADCHCEFWRFFGGLGQDLLMSKSI